MKRILKMNCLPGQKLLSMTALKTVGLLFMVKFMMSLNSFPCILGIFTLYKFIYLISGNLILDGAGGDCTSMFESYHPNYLTKRGVSEEYLVGKVRDYNSFYSWDGGFYQVLKERVEKAIPRKKRRYSLFLIAKTIIIITLYFISVYLYAFNLNFWTCLLFGFMAS